MKIVVSAQTTITLAAQADLVIYHVTQEPISSYQELRNAVANTTKFANHSITEANGEYTLEINDELFFKYANIYLRIARVVAPFIAPLKALCRVVSEDINDIQRFMSQRK